MWLASFNQNSEPVLQAFVIDNALDIGFAFDGDADRCICIDERGKIIDGDGEERDDLERFVAENNLQDRLILKGNVKNVDDYLRKASIFAVTSKIEGLGLSILEAREMKVPCVAFDVKMGPRELIHNGTDGYLINPFDCDEMAKLIGIE